MNAVQLAPTPKRPSRAQQVVEVVCQYYDVSAEVLRAHMRTCGCRPKKNSCACGCSPRGKAYTEARMIISYLLSEDLAIAHTRIGPLLNRDHSTIIHHVYKARRQLPLRSDLRWHLEQVRAILRENGVLRS